CMLSAGATAMPVLSTANTTKETFTRFAWSLWKLIMGSGGLGFGACSRDGQRSAHHDVEVPSEDQVGDEHEGAPDGPPGPVPSGGNHRVDEGHTLDPGHAFHRAARHQ